MKKRSSWGKTGVTGEIEKARLQLERAKFQRSKAEELTKTLEQDRAKNGYAQMVIQALGASR